MVSLPAFQHMGLFAKPVKGLEIPFHIWGTKTPKRDKRGSSTILVCSDFGGDSAETTSLIKLCNSIFLSVAWVSLVFYSICFLDLYVYFLHQVREVFYHYFHMDFQFLTLILPVTHCCRCLKLSQRLFILSLFFFLDSFFFFAILIGCFLLPYLTILLLDTLYHLLYC